MWWILAGCLLGVLVWRMPQTRAQEARVLETAREMLGEGWRGWMVPHVGERERMKKPPLAYWLAGGCFKVFGVSEQSGRIPFALASWLTLGVTYAAGRRLFGPRAGLLAAGSLMGTFIFCRYGALAETDVLAMCFVTTGIWAIWRGAESEGWSRVGWHQLSAVAIAMAILGKGAPAIFPILFLVFFAWSQRRWRIVWEWCASGAPITLLILSAPWFIYVWLATKGAAVLANEVEIVFGAGQGHNSPPWSHALALLKNTLPWVPLLVAAIVAAVPKWRQDLRVRGVLVWCLVIFVPLSAVPKKQEHYLLPLIPPLMVLVGWMLNRVLAGGDEKLKKAVRVLTVASIALGLAAGPGMIIGGKLARGFSVSTDWGAGIEAVLILAAVGWIYRARGLGAGVNAMIAGGAVLMVAVIGVWAPTLERVTYRQVAHQIEARFGDGPYAFYQSESLPLAFALRRIVAYHGNARQLARALADDPSVVVLMEERKQTVTAPEGLSRVGEFAMDEKKIVAFRAMRP